MSKKNIRLFVPLMKVDIENRLLIGTMTAEVEDRTGEVMDYVTSKAFFVQWSEAISKATDGKSVGNLRIMHGLSVAGIVKSMDFNDDDRKIDIVAEVIDDTTWDMILKGAYTGFSIGGRYVRKFREDGVQKYTVDPYEVSVVDYPCLPTGTFQIIKADGAVEESTFQVYEPTNDELVSKAQELAGSDKKGAWSSYLEPAREALIKARLGDDEDEEEDDDLSDKEKDEEDEDDDAEKSVEDNTEKPSEADEAKKADEEDEDAEKAARDRVSQVWKASDGSTFNTKAEAVTHETTLASAPADVLSAAVKGLQDSLKEAQGVEDTSKAVTFADELKSLNDELLLWKSLRQQAYDRWGNQLVAKSLYAVSRLAEMIDGMSCLITSQLWDKAYESIDGTEKGDGKITELFQIVKNMSETLIELAREETSEVIAELTQRGASLGDDVPEALIELTVSDQLAKARGKEVPVRRVHQIADVAKALGLLNEEENRALVTENTSLKKTIEDTAATVDGIRQEVEKLKSLAMPSKALKTITVSKEDDVSGITGSTSPSGSLEEMLAKASPDQLATIAIKIAQRTPLKTR